MARSTTKEVYVTISNKKSIENFIELISDALRYMEFTLTYKEGVVKIRLYGEKEVVNESVATVKSLGRMFLQSSTPNKNGYYAHNLKLIQQMGSRIISLETLSTVLNYLGFPSRVNEQDLITTATMKEVQRILEELHDLIQETPLSVKTQVMKRVLATISYCTSLDSDFVLEKGLELEYFKIQKNTISINYEPQKCISDLIQILSKDSVQAENNDYSERRTNK